MKEDGYYIWEKEQQKEKENIHFYFEDTREDVMNQIMLNEISKAQKNSFLNWSNNE